MQLLVTITKEAKSLNHWALAGIVVALLILSFIKIYLETKEEEEQDEHDRWNDPDNWRPH